MKRAGPSVMGLCLLATAGEVVAGQAGFDLGKERQRDEGFAIMHDEPTEADRRLTVYGEVIHANRLDLDKSARNPRYQISLTVRIERTEGAETGLAPQDLVKFQGKEARVLEHVSRAPRIGDRVVIESTATAFEPRILEILEIRFPQD